MIGNKLEQSIIGVFQDDLSSTYSINEISKTLNKAYPYINKKTNFFLKEDIIKKISVGKSYRCFLNLSNEKTKIFMSMNEINKKESFLQKNSDFKPIVEEISFILSASSVSHDILAIVLHKKNLLFVVNNINVKEQILSMSALSYLNNYHPIFLSKKSFQEYFINTLVFKSRFNEYIVFSKIDSYIDIISEINNKLLLKGLTANDLAYNLRSDNET